MKCDAEHSSSAGPVPAPPVRALLRCYRCGDLTQDGQPVGTIEADAHPPVPVVACPPCVRPGEGGQ